MKYITLIIGLLVVGCETLTPEQKQQKALRDSVVGEYGTKFKNASVKTVFLKNGIVEAYRSAMVDGAASFSKVSEHKWEIVNGEIHIKPSSRITHVWRINANKSITYIAMITDGELYNFPNSHQTTEAKIK
jgi:hypothetical protein